MPLTRQAILHHPITRIVVGLALTLGIGLPAMLATQSLYPAPRSPNPT